MVKPRIIKKAVGLFKGGINGYSGVTTSIMTISSTRTYIEAVVQVNPPIKHAQTISESVGVVVT